METSSAVPGDGGRYPTEDVPRQIMAEPEYERLIANYESGRMTESDVLLRLIPTIAELDNGWTSLNDDWRDRIANAVNLAPFTDDAWDAIRVFHAGSWITPGACEESQRQNNELLKRYRRGVETIRGIIGGVNGG